MNLSIAFIINAKTKKEKTNVIYIINTAPNNVDKLLIKMIYTTNNKHIPKNIIPIRIEN